MAMRTKSGLKWRNWKSGFAVFLQQQKQQRDPGEEHASEDDRRKESDAKSGEDSSGEATATRVLRSNIIGGSD